MGIKSYITNAFGKVFGVSWDAPLVVTRRGDGGGGYHSPVDFTAQIKGKDTLHLTGISPTITDGSQFECVRATGPFGELIGEWFPSEDHHFFYTASTGYLTISDADFENAVTVDVELSAQHRAYAPTEDAYQGYAVNPEHAWTQQNQNVATAQGDGTTNYRWDVDMYKYFGIQIADTPGATGDQTYTVWASWEDNGTAIAAAAYVDVTQPWFGFASVTSAQITANAYAGILEINTPLTCKFLQLQVVRANDAAATDGAWTIDARGTY